MALSDTTAADTGTRLTLTTAIPRDEISPDVLRAAMADQISRFERLSEAEGIPFNWETYSFHVELGLGDAARVWSKVLILA